MKKTTPMNTGLKLTVLALPLLMLNPQPSTCLAQGSLTPPGAPAPTMKSLDQIEPRIPISSVPFTISAPGSYYLTTNVTVVSGDAITIAADNVTLDLNGFTIASTAPSAGGHGILLGGVGGRSDIHIFNGHIKGGVTNNAGVFGGSGFGTGIECPGGIPENLLVTDVSVSGCLYEGIDLGFVNSTVVRSCTVQTVGGNGIYANTVTHSAAYNCGNIGIFSVSISDGYGNTRTGGYGIYAFTAHNCYGETSGSGVGLFALSANGCYDSSNSGKGLIASTANGCYGSSSSQEGLSANTATGCYGSSSTYYGLFVNQNAENCYGVSGAAWGLTATIANNCVGYNNSLNSGNAGLACTVAIGCLGVCSSGPGVQAYIANSCYGLGVPNVSASYKYNMP